MEKWMAFHSQIIGTGAFFFCHSLFHSPALPLLLSLLTFIFLHLLLIPFNILVTALGVKPKQEKKVSTKNVSTDQTIDVWWVCVLQSVFNCRVFVYCLGTTGWECWINPTRLHMVMLVPLAQAGKLWLVHVYGLCVFYRTRKVLTKLLDHWVFSLHIPSLINT